MTLALTNDSTKSRVLYLLRGWSGGTAQDVADALGVTVPAARRHLLDLLEAGYVESHIEKPAGRGRPQHVFMLTSNAEEVFPKRYAELCGDILSHVQTLYGEGAILDVLSARNAKLLELWGERVVGEGLFGRLEALVGILNECGYQAALERGDDGAIYLIEGNCPSLEVARRFSQLCSAESDLYERLLGVSVVRETHIALGHSACRYRIGA